MILPSDQLKIERRARGDSSIRYHNLNWYKKLYIDELIKPRDDHTPDPFILGRTYTFVYDDPKFKEELEFYSAFPISLFIGYRQDSVGNPMMINLHFIPPKIRAAVLDKVFTSNMNQIDKIEKVINRGGISVRNLKNSDYHALVKMLNGSGFGFAIRSYIPERIKTEPRAISHRDLWRVLTFSNQFLIKKEAREIYRLYKARLGFEPFKKEPKIIL